MKPCSRHEAEIISALKRKGLWHLVTSEPDEIKRRTTLWLRGVAAVEDIDPLIITLLEIRSKALLFCGGYLLSRQVEYCPLCEAAVHTGLADLGIEWIDNCTDMVLLLCKTNSLIKVS